MEYQIYLDVLFFWNFLLDVLMLHQTGLLLFAGTGSSKKSIGRILLGGGIGAAGSCLVTLGLGLPIFLKVILTIPGLSCLMVWVGFSRGRGRPGRRLFVRQYLTLLGDSLLLEGLVVFLQYRFMLNTFRAVLLAGGLTEGGILLYRLLKARKNHVYDVCLSYDGRPIYIKGFYDTGNHLACPWNQKAVHIVDESCLFQSHSDEKRRNPKGEEQKEQGKEELREGFFYIPFSSVGKEGGLMKAVQADWLKIFREEGELFIERPVVALGAASLFYGRPYRMILHSSVAEQKGD